MSVFGFVLRGLFEPVVWRNTKWSSNNPNKMKGIRKWREKNRFRVELLIEKPPQSHCTKRFPISGIADKRFVITVAPQNDIWPHGKTYPRNAVIIKINNIVTPVIHVKFKRYEEKIMFRAMWMKIAQKNNLAIFMWINRMKKPISILREIKIIELKASSVEGLKWVDKKMPLKIWSAKIIPNSDPQFHI